MTKKSDLRDIASTCVVLLKASEIRKNLIMKLLEEANHSELVGIIKNLLKEILESSKEEELLMKDDLLNAETASDDVLNMRIDDLKLTHRTLSYYKANDVFFIGQLVQLSYAQAQKSPKYLETREILLSQSLSFGMNLPDWKPPK